MSKQESLMNYMGPNSAKSMFAKSLEQYINPHDMESFGALNVPEEGDGKRSKDQNTSPTEMMHDKKIKSALPSPVFSQNGTRPKSVSK